MLSALDMFKIGIGPSSSHTLGPMKAARRFIASLASGGLVASTARVAVDLYGSLALTGLGHQADQAIFLGLAGHEPEEVDTADIPVFMQALRRDKKLALPLPGLPGGHVIPFDPERDLRFHSDALPRHENALTLTAYGHDAASDASRETVLLKKTYYSIGGGVVLEEGESTLPDSAPGDALDPAAPYPFRSAAELLEHCASTGLSIYGVVLRNELAARGKDEIAAYCEKIWQVMQECMHRGLYTEGLLPGPLRVPRRAPLLRRRLAASGGTNPLHLLDWVNMCAMAVAEENAAGGRVVTAPTNGACGIIPAVFAYYRRFMRPEQEEDDLLQYFLTAGAIGLLFRMNASISGAEVGCQGEVGVACSMAAAGLAALLGASPREVCTAAEIGMEHNLGLTCDPVGGQVQVPCIERNAINAVKAINAARMAMERHSTPVISLDGVIAAMYSTGKDMNPKYRETAQGGLAATGCHGC